MNCLMVWSRSNTDPDETYPPPKKNPTPKWPFPPKKTPKNSFKTILNSMQSLCECDWGPRYCRRLSYGIQNKLPPLTNSKKASNLCRWWEVMDFFARILKHHKWSTKHPIISNWAWNCSANPKPIVYKLYMKLLMAFCRKPARSSILAAVIPTCVWCGLVVHFEIVNILYLYAWH